jgi:hypothetical protein
VSDIDITFPLWAVPLLIGALYWPVSLGIAAVFAGLGAMTHGNIRIALFVLSFVALLPVLSIPVAGLVDALERQANRAAWARTHETLTAQRQISGLTIPAGTEVTWTDDARSAVAALALARPAKLLGVTLAGTLENVYARWWSGTLAGPTEIDDWPCAAGDVWLSHDAHLMRCVLAADHTYRGLAIPAGTEITIAASHRVGYLQLANDRTMALPPIAAILPAGGSLFFGRDGTVERAYAPTGTTIRVAAVELHYDILWIYQQAPAEMAPDADLQPPASVRGELAFDTTLDGVASPTGTMIDVDIATGAVHAVPKR